MILGGSVTRSAAARVRRLASHIRPFEEVNSLSARKLFVKRARVMTPLVGAETDDGLLFVVSTRDRLGRGVFAQRGRQDMDVLNNALRILSDHGARFTGTTFVDVGANIGTTTVTALRRHGFQRGVSLEPEPENFRILRLNLVANDVDSAVTALQVAVSDRVGEAFLQVSERSSGIHELVKPGEGRHLDDVLPVRSVTLDSLIDEGEIDFADVGMLWIDAAGGEAAVLSGAVELLGKGIPVVFAVRPMGPTWKESRDRLAELFASYTGFVSLRPLEFGVSNDLASVLDAFSKPGDVLAFRR